MSFVTELCVKDRPKLCPFHALTTQIIIHSCIACKAYLPWSKFNIIKYKTCQIIITLSLFFLPWSQTTTSGTALNLHTKRVIMIGHVGCCSRRDWSFPIDDYSWHGTTLGPWQRHQRASTRARKRGSAQDATKFNRLSRFTPANSSNSANHTRCHELSLQRIELAIRSVSSLLGNQLVASESQRACDHGQRTVVTLPVKLSDSFLSPFSRHSIDFIPIDS